MNRRYEVQEKTMVEKSGDDSQNVKQLLLLLLSKAAKRLEMMKKCRRKDKVW